jgi:hypothetical protein
MARRLRAGRDGHSSATPVARRLKRPTRTAARTRVEARASLPSLFGLAPGGVCRAASVAGSAVRSYRTISPLRLPCGSSRSLLCGTFPGLRRACARFGPAGRYPAPHVHGARTFLSGPPFGIGPKRPSGRLTSGDVSVFRSELNDVRATSLTDCAAYPWSTDRRAHRRARAGSGAGMR